MLNISLFKLTTAWTLCFRCNVARLDSEFIWLVSRCAKYRLLSQRYIRQGGVFSTLSLQTRRRTLPYVCIHTDRPHPTPLSVISFCAERCKRLVMFDAAFEVKGGEHSSLEEHTLIYPILYLAWPRDLLRAGLVYPLAAFFSWIPLLFFSSLKLRPPSCSSPCSPLNAARFTHVTSNCA